jgi:Uma2 family endonuclease
VAQELTAGTELKAQAPPPLRMSYEEFLQWADEDTWAEWVDGEVIILSPASDPHQDLNTFLLALLRFFVDAHGLGVVFGPPFQMKTGPTLPGREPDIVFVAREHFYRRETAYLNGPADLVVEIVSPDSRTRDSRDKFHEYEHGGVPEYWMLDPFRKEAKFYQLGDDGPYHLVLPDENGFYESAVLKGLRLREDWLWQKPLPPVPEVLRELGLI